MTKGDGIMIIRIDVNSDEALYVQLMNQIKNGIAKSYLKPGDKLPSVRQLSSDIGINMHTVSKAYNLLKDEGVIIINRRKGVLVSDDVFGSLKAGYEDKFNEKIQNLIHEGILNGISKDSVIEKVNNIYNERSNKS